MKPQHHQFSLQIISQKYFQEEFVPKINFMELLECLDSLKGGNNWSLLELGISFDFRHFVLPKCTKLGIRNIIIDERETFQWRMNASNDILMKRWNYFNCIPYWLLIQFRFGYCSVIWNVWPIHDIDLMSLWICNKYSWVDGEYISSWMHNLIKSNHNDTLSTEIHRAPVRVLNILLILNATNNWTKNSNIYKVRIYWPANESEPIYNYYQMIHIHSNGGGTNTIQYNMYESCTHSILMDFAVNSEYLNRYND